MTHAFKDVVIFVYCCDIYRHQVWVLCFADGPASRRDLCVLAARTRNTIIHLAVIWMVGAVTPTSIRMIIQGGTGNGSGERQQKELVHLRQPLWWWCTLVGRLHAEH